MSRSICTLPANFHSNNISLKDSTIVVTGATTDLGYAVSVALASKGATIVILDRKERLMAPLYDQICANGDAEPLMLAIDLAKAEPLHYEQITEGLGESFDKIDGLLHLDLLSAPLAPFNLVQPEHWAKSFEHAVMRPMLLTKSLLPLMASSPNASVVFASFASGRQGRAYWGAVGAAYAALENMSESLDHEFDDVRFNTIDPGKVNTAIRHKYYPAEALSELRNFDDPWLLDHFVYLLSEASKQVSGERLVCDLL